MIRVKHIVFTLVALLYMACAPESNNDVVNHYLCDFEGAKWDALVDSNPNGDNLLNGSVALTWHDEESDLAGEVTIPFEGYWGGAAISNHCSQDLQNNGSPTDQLYVYAEGAYSGSNFLICNCFFGGVELRFESKTSYIESVMVANTTYSRAVTTNGNHLTAPLSENTSIWVEATGYINGSEAVQATTKLYLYKNGKPAFEGWTKWYMTSMSRCDRVVFDVKWNGTDYNPYPAYFAMDDIKVVRQERAKTINN
ncbi:MAG: DUF4465 domain-containing protein [Alistipes sp.]|nr:DUF4465 domain-containing protein [Alistipes sp.]